MEDNSGLYPEPPAGSGGMSKADRLRSNAMAVLDFHAVRQQLADCTTFPAARQLALQLLPSYDRRSVEDLQSETAEGRVFLELAGDLNLHSPADISSAVTRAALEGVLTGMELLGVADSLEVQRRTRRALIRAPDTVRRLTLIAEGIPDLEELLRQIRTRISDRGEVEDDATPALKTLRSQVRRAYGSVTQALTRTIRSAAGREALQDDVISVRGDRLVLQVKVEMRHHLPGIVHDASNSGATVFVEPFTTVDLCNAWRELVLDEEREVRAVLRDLSTLVGVLADDIRRGNELVAGLDLILARARHAAKTHGVAALSRTSQPRQSGPSGTNELTVRLLRARHPLLDDTVIPISVNVGPGWSVVVITGPNTGGKTVAMKTVGLLALMHQSGLQIPADEDSSLMVFDGVYADVGDQQSIEQSVSTFGSHISNAIDILAEAGQSSLVLLDELGTSTDPEEGSALAKSILGHLASKGISTVATTHHHSVAAYAEGARGMMNASVDLDPSTLRPTYQLTMGVPGRSYAMSVASRLGMPGEIMDKAKELMEPQYLRFEDWLTELQRERHQLQTSLEEAERSRARAESLRRDLEEQLRYLASHRDDMVGNLRRELLANYEDVKRKLRRAESAISWNVGNVWNAGPAETSDAGADLADVWRDLEAQRTRVPGPLDAVPIAAGESVYVQGLNLRGTVVSVSEQDGDAEISVGKVRLRMDLNRLSRVDEPVEEAPASVRLDLGPMLTSMELDLRGLRAEEALASLESFMDKAVRDGLSSIRIIHGRGTGALRQAVRENLTRHPLARTFAAETPERGGDGVTVVELA